MIRNPLPEIYGWSALLQPYLKVKRENSVWLCQANREDYLAFKISYAGITWPGWAEQTNRCLLSLKSIRPNSPLFGRIGNWSLGKPLSQRRSMTVIRQDTSYSAKWITNGMVAWPFRSATQWQGGPHYYISTRTPHSKPPSSTPTATHTHFTLT